MRYRPPAMNGTRIIEIVFSEDRNKLPPLASFTPTGQATYL
jgi:hypothetical protein